MSKKVGLEAVFDVTQFEKGQAAYFRALGQVAGQTEATARAGGGSLQLMSGPLASAAALAGGALVAGLAAAGTAAVAFGTTSVTAAMGFEKQMDGVQAVLMASQDEMGKLNDLALALGLDPALVVTSQQAGEAMEMLAKNGLSVQQILDGAARSTVLLANATGADFAVAADIGTSAMTVFKIKAEDMGDAIDEIVGVTNVSKFGIEDYALALAQGGGVASAAGVEFSDFNASIAAISPLFASGSDAGTSFKTFLTRLIPASDEAAGLMKELGLNFFDAKGQLLPMAEVTGQLEKAMKGLTEEQKNNALQTIFGTDAFRAAAALADTGKEKFLELSGALAKVDAEEAARVRVDNLAGAIDILKGAFEGLQLVVGGIPLGLLKDLALQAAGGIGTFTLGLKDLMTQAQASGDPLNFLVSKFLEANPALVPLFDAVKNLGAAFAEDFPQMKAYAADMLNFVKEQFGTLGPQIIGNVASTLNAIAGFWREHGDETMAVVNGAFRFITVTIGVALTVISGLMAAFTQARTGDWQGAWQTMQDTTGSVMNAILGIVGTDLESFTTMWAGVFQLLGIILSKGWNDLKLSVSQGMLDAIAAAQAIMSGWNELGRAIIEGMVQGVIESAVQLAQAVGNAVMNAIGAGEQAGDIDSPSGETRRRIGRPLGMGAVEGLKDTRLALAGAMNNVVGAGLNGPRLPNNMPARTLNNSNTINQYFQYQPTYGQAPKSPSQDFAMMQVLMGA